MMLLIHLLYFLLGCKLGIKMFKNSRSEKHETVKIHNCLWAVPLGVGEGGLNMPLRSPAVV